MGENRHVPCYFNWWPTFRSWIWRFAEFFSVSFCQHSAVSHKHTNSPYTLKRVGTIDCWCLIGNECPHTHLFETVIRRHYTSLLITSNLIISFQVHSRVLAILTCVVAAYNMAMVISSGQTSWEIALRVREACFIFCILVESFSQCKSKMLQCRNTNMIGVLIFIGSQFET